jgi:hypothetical protein
MLFFNQNVFIYFGQNSYFGPSTIIRGSVSSMNFQNGCFSPQTLLLGSISSYNYKDDHFSLQTLHFEFNFIYELSSIFCSLNFYFSTPLCLCSTWNVVLLHLVSSKTTGDWR